MARFEGESIFENSFYLTFILKPGMNDSLEESIRELEEMQIIVTQTLASYKCEVLSIYVHNGHQFSQFYEFIAYPYNGFWERVPVTSLPLFQAVQTSALHHGYKLLETRFPNGGNRYSAFFDLKDFPEPTTRGKFNPLLELPFPFVMCLSFTFINTADSIRLINQALNKMESAGDEATDQMKDMDFGKGAIMSGEVYFGELHGALAVYGKTGKQAEDRGYGSSRAQWFMCNPVRSCQPFQRSETFFSMFPGNVKRRPRQTDAKNGSGIFFGLFSMNTYSSGKQYGNPVGDGSGDHAAANTGAWCALLELALLAARSGFSR